MKKTLYQHLKKLVVHIGCCIIFHHYFLQFWLAPTSTFSLDVKFNENETKIIGMRFLIQAVNISGTEHEKEMVRALRKICKESPLNVTVFHPYFVFFDQVCLKIELIYLKIIFCLFQFELVKPISLQNMILGAVVMMSISFVFIPNPLCSLWVAFSIISIETGVIGYMALWKVNLDSISMINLIMCLGFSVDFTAHICYAYMSSTALKPEDRVRECLYAVGLPIFQGAISTILGMVALLLADSYIFSVFFKMVFLVVFCGAMHGLFLLPVLLSLFGPGSCSRQDKNLEITMSNIDKTLPQPYCIPHPQFTLNAGHIKNYDSSLKENQKNITDIDKDLGLGTSEENSSESSSARSNNYDKHILNSQKFQETWKLDSHSDYSPKDFKSDQVSLSKQRHNRSKSAVYNKTNNSKDEARSKNFKNFRRYSPPESAYYRSTNLIRSHSYNNIQNSRYIQELRFP